MVKDVKFEACKMDTYAEKLMNFNHEYMYEGVSKSFEPQAFSPFR